MPQVLSLLSAKRTLSGAAATVSDLAAAAAVVGALTGKKGQGHSYVHDDFRLMRGTGVYASTSRVSAQRQELIGRKL